MRRASRKLFNQFLRTLPGGFQFARSLPFSFPRLVKSELVAFRSSNRTEVNRDPYTLALDDLYRAALAFFKIVGHAIIVIVLHLSCTSKEYQSTLWKLRFRVPSVTRRWDENVVRLPAR